MARHPCLRILSALGLLAGLGATAWIVEYSYVLNTRPFFYDGLAGMLALLLLAKFRWPKSAAVQLPANTLLLCVLLLPVADAIYTRHWNHAQDAARRRRLPGGAYSFEAAQADPVMFQIWWGRFLAEWDKLSQQILTPDPRRKLPYLLKPRSAGTFFGSHIRVNSLGFRDNEFDVAKHGHYRIVAIGESTTMGLPLSDRDRPWPDLLEGLIRERLHLPKPVEVINAGIAGYNLQNSLVRLKRDVLRLKPDMIISYHGYNGFRFLDETLESVAKLDLAEKRPKFIPRPMLLLARAEYRLRLLDFRRRRFPRELPPETLERLGREVMKSPLAGLYEQLINVAGANHIALVLLSHNLAVNAQSPRNVVRFYQAGFPHVRYCIQANALQTSLLRQLAQRHPEISFVDTSANLDGAHERFIDLVHFNQAGNRQLAESVFHGIQPLLNPKSTGS